MSVNLVNEEQFTIVNGSAGAQTLGDGSRAYPRVSKDSARVIAPLHGALRETAARRNIFCVASQAESTTSVALTVTYTGIVLSNTYGSGVTLSILKVGWGFTTAQVAKSVMALGVGWSNTAVVHTTPITTAFGSYLDGLRAPRGLVDAAATLPTGPKIGLPFLSAFTAGSLGETGMSWCNVNGAIEVAPGGYVFIYGLTASRGFGAIMWEEIGEDE